VRKEYDLYGLKCRDVAAMVSELNVLVAHFGDHFEMSDIACVREREGENISERKKKKNDIIAHIDV
jgi:hypothetical protein